MHTGVSRARFTWLFAVAAALVVLLSTMTSFADAASATDDSSTSTAAEPDEAGTFMIWQGLTLSPGASAIGGWNNTPPGNSYSVDVRPIATTVTTTCQLEVVKSWRVQNWNADNTRELEIWWQVQNTGSTRCMGDVYLTWVH